MEAHIVNHQCGWCGDVTEHRCANGVPYTSEPDLKTEPLFNPVQLASLFRERVWDAAKDYVHANKDSYASALNYGRWIGYRSACFLHGDDEAFEWELEIR